MRRRAGEREGDPARRGRHSNGARVMEAVLWYVLTGTRGGSNRVRAIRALDERPRNANQLAKDLDLDYKTVRHHLDVLQENNVVKASDDDYGAVYLLTDQARGRWDTIEEIIEKTEGPSTSGRANPAR